MPMSFGPKCQLRSSLLVFMSLLLGTSRAKTSFCSEINTSESNSNSSVYQSNGLCTDFCIQNYAFAILQDQSCWCSNYIPASTTTGCTLNCPGYPFEKCGGDGLYGYIALGKVSPSGTIGEIPPSPSPITSTSQQVTVTVTPIIITRTEITRGTFKPSSSATSSPSSSSSTSTSSTPSITTSVTSLAWTPTPITSVKTISGSGLTVTVTPTAPPTITTSTPMSISDSKNGLTTGAAVALTAGLVILVAVFCSIIYLYLRKRRENSLQGVESLGDRGGSSAGFGGQIPSRTMSENSRYVLGTDGRRVVEAWEFKDETGPTKSKLVPVDPRLDPFAPVYRTGENKSRDSVNTLRDDLDYSRRVHGGQRGPVLRAMNPDLDDEV
ncbi:putative er membrane protein [Erysiphe neolycopersici]|uniref:Putative er membrane protein n=1 Tax=Erysiphe neolycopersici TaxID=212602 RepID=A0A420HNB1_9PEZI|nr:putative er membrane protein [Erysiphe neolycopersici]